MSEKEKELRQSTASRTDAVLHRKLLLYLVPAMLTGAAFSLSEFVDSMIVANLLGSQAMGVIQLGTPVVLLCATIAQMIGVGGSTHYAVSLGERDHKKAAVVFSASFSASLLLGLLLALVGFVFFRPLSGILCTKPSLADGFDAYFSATLYSVPFLVTIMALVAFLPAAGAPGLCTAVNVVANVVNIAMDYVYIRVFSMGVEGAAWATFTGYACGAVILVYAVFSKRVGIRKKIPSPKDWRILPEILKTGGASGLTQLGYAVKFGFCNRLALQFGGVPGLVGMSLVSQGLSVVSIFIAAVQDSAMPILGMLHGQRDSRGKAGVLKRALLLVFFFSVFCTLFFVLFPVPFAALYNVREGEQLAMGVRALSITSLLYPLRGVCIIFMKYLQVIGHKLYAALISAMDGFVLIIPAALLLTAAAGIDGLWWSYPVSGVLLLLYIAVSNLVIRKKQQKTYSGQFPGEKDPAQPILDVTILDQNQDIALLSERVQAACEEAGVSPTVSRRAALLLEEMAVYLRNHKKREDYMDIMMRAYPDSVEIDFRNIGVYVTPDKETEDDIRENMLLMKSMAREISNSYIMGMNNIRIVLDRDA